jgi:hypothetical protein
LTIMATPLTDSLRAHPPLLHAAGDQYFGLSWDALAWIETHVSSDMSTLETGAGGSTVVFASTGSAHTTISPAEVEHGRIRAYCEERNVSTDAVAFIPGASHEVLTSTWQAHPLDVVLIDGAHGFPYPTLDWILLAPHIKVGGHVLVDDAQLEPVTPLVRYLNASPSWQLESVLGIRTPCFRKLDDREPSFDTDVPSRLHYDYLPIFRRPVAWARLELLDRPPFRQLVRALSTRRARKVDT